MNNTDQQASVEETLKELDNLLPRLPDPQTMTNSQKDREKKQLRERLKALNATPRSDWHREFEDILQTDVEELEELAAKEQYKLVAHINREVTIGEDAPRADFIIVALDKLPKGAKSIFRQFRKQNLVEYKRPDETITERMIWKTGGYGTLLIGTTKDSQYKIDDVTISLFASKINKTLFERLHQLGMLFETNVKGIYRVEKICPLPYQIVISDELEGDENAAYRALSDHAQAADVEKLLDDFKTKTGETKDRYHRILHLIELKNPGIVAKLIEGDAEMEGRRSYVAHRG